MFNNSTSHNRNKVTETIGEPAGRAPGGSHREVGEPGGNRTGFPLSKAHISPHLGIIEYVEGGSLLKTSLGVHHTQVGGGTRGVINGFTNQSRRRLLEKISMVRRDAELPCFATLTYPSYFPTIEGAKCDLDAFSKRLNRKFPEAGAIWKLEPQERGAPHFHMLIWGVDEIELFSWLPYAWYEIAGNGDENHLKFHLGELHDSEPCVAKVRTFKGVWAYAAKYLGKTFEVAGWNEKWTGRYWGVFKPSNIPFGEKKKALIDCRDVIQIMRFQKRFMSMRPGRSLPSLKTFCDANQWIDKLYPGKRENGKQE